MNIIHTAENCIKCAMIYTFPIINIQMADFSLSPFLTKLILEKCEILKLYKEKWTEISSKSNF